MSDKEKVCTICERKLPNTSEYFYMRSRTNGEKVTRAACKKCETKLKKARNPKKNKRDKICKQCGELLPNTDKFFYKQKVNGKTYLRLICIECTKDERITYYDKNRGEILDKLKEKYRRGLQKSK